MPDPELLEIDGDSLDLADIDRFLRTPGMRVGLSPAAEHKVGRARAAVEAMLAQGAPIYGINTGFGRLADRRVDPARLRELQLNLVRSHCCGVGDALGADETRLVLLLRANALAKGYSGLRLATLAGLIAMLNAGVLPVIPERGSVGASGDLAPLAHLAAVLIGEGEAVHRGERLSGAEALARAGLEPITLDAKEGLSLINGTQVMTAIGAKAYLEARRLLTTATVISALTLDALRGTDAAFDARIHAVRPHPGQVEAAALLGRLLRDSQVRESHRESGVDHKVQDAYSLRCVPQVHGAMGDALGHIGRVLEREVNAATDNPLVFPDEGDVLSGGNFHGQPIALVLDLLAIAAAELGAITERRIERLVNPDYSGLPAFLVAAEEGLHSGLMIAQVTAAALVSENKTLAHPASVDSIPTSAGFEDHVSMGVTAALKARQCLRNVETVVGIELVCACQALEFLRPLATSPPLRAVYDLVRRHVAPLERDRRLAEDIGRATALVRSGAVLEAAGVATGV